MPCWPFIRVIVPLHQRITYSFSWVLFKSLAVYITYSLQLAPFTSVAEFNTKWDLFNLHLNDFSNNDFDFKQSKENAKSIHDIINYCEDESVTSCVRQNCYFLPWISDEKNVGIKTIFSADGTIPTTSTSTSFGIMRFVHIWLDLIVFGLQNKRK